MANIPESEICSIASLASDGAANGLTSMDKLDSLAALVFVLAQTIKNLGPGAPDYTDICALAKSLQAYDSLPDYERNAARLQAWSEISENTTSVELDWDEVRAAIQCARCCDITKQSLESAITYLLCRLSTLIQPV